MAERVAGRLVEQVRAETVERPAPVQVAGRTVLLMPYCLVARGADRPGRGRMASRAKSAWTSRILRRRSCPGGKGRADGSPGGVEDLLEADVVGREAVFTGGVADEFT